MPNIVLVANQKYETRKYNTAELQQWLEEQGHQVHSKILQDVESTDKAKDQTLDLKNVDLAISLGGDGAILHTVEVVSDAGVPVLGVNYGQMGYLAEVEPKNVKEAINSFFKGDYKIEERMRLSATMINDSNDKAKKTNEINKNKRSALNEVFLGKVHSGHTIRLKISINGKSFLNYEADGMIVSTPTGSTAYSLSAGGPIMEPSIEAIIVTPVAPHMIFDRSFILSPDSELKIEVAGDYITEFNMDGFSLGSIKPKESVLVAKADQPARVVTFEEKHFHKVLKSKFGLKDR